MVLPRRHPMRRGHPTRHPLRHRYYPSNVALLPTRHVAQVAATVTAGLWLRLLFKHGHCGTASASAASCLCLSAAPTASRASALKTRPEGPSYATATSSTASGAIHTTSSACDCPVRLVAKPVKSAVPVFVFGPASLAATKWTALQLRLSAPPRFLESSAPLRLRLPLCHQPIPTYYHRRHHHPTSRYPYRHRRGIMFRPRPRPGPLRPEQVVL